MTKLIDVDKRLPVLRAALMVEYFSTFFLSSLLGIEDFRKTKTFAGSSALSFNTKINMLIDIEALDAESRKVFLKFMEIRNVFMHDLTAKTYKDCVDKIEGAESFLLKKYKSKAGLPLEDQLENAVLNLCADVIDLMSPILKKLKEKIRADVDNKMNAELKEFYFEKLKEQHKEIEQLKARSKES